MQDFDVNETVGIVSSPHKTNVIGRNGQRDIKGHGRGTNRIKLLIITTGSAIACTDEDGTTWDWNFYSADDGDEITIDYC